MLYHSYGILCKFQTQTRPGSGEGCCGIASIPTLKQKENLQHLKNSQYSIAAWKKPN